MTSPALHRPPSPSGGFAAISKYNPHLWTPDQLRAIFVARQRELADLTDTLSRQAEDEVCQHCLLVGARGMGKSTLMQRLALVVEDTPALHAAWLPLRFPEEQYTVNNLAQFWANVLDSLADALERQGEPTDAIDATATRLSTLPQTEQAEATLKAIVHISQQRQQRLLLLVDNTDLLLNNIGRQAQWALRQVLQTEPRLMWVGGSYQSLEANSEYHDAFLDFFRVLELRPLSLTEMQEALLALATTFGGDEARERLSHQLKQQPERLPTLRLLSGGNPRTTVMLYELLASGQSGHVRSDLEALLDNMTPLYKARLDALAELPRKLLAHILGHWAPISLAQLTDVSQVAKTSISPQLQRLEQEGLIEKTKLHGTTRSGYQAAERFFNIWYLMRLSPRRQRTRLSWLVEFMRLWFSSTELCHLARTRLSTRPEHNPQQWDYDSALADALPAEVPEKHSLRWSLLKHLQAQRDALEQVFDFDGVDQDYKGADDYLRRARTLPEKLRRCPHAKTPADQQEWVDAVMGSISLTLDEKTRVADQSETLSRVQWDQLLSLFKEEARRSISVFGLVAFETVRSRVLELDFFPDVLESELAYRQIRDCFASQPEALRFAATILYAEHQDEWTLKTQQLAQHQCPEDPELAFRIAWLLHERLGRYEEAEQAYRQVIALDEKLGAPWDGLGNLLQNHLGRYEEAEQAHRQALALEDHPIYRSNLARLLWRCGSQPKAIAQYEQISQNPQTPDFLLLQAHLVLNNQQRALEALNRIADEAEQGSTLAAFRLREQVQECTALGLGERLADWMQQSPHALYLQPMIQALYTLAGASTKLQDLPVEVQNMADAVVRATRNKMPTPKT